MNSNVFLSNLNVIGSQIILLIGLFIIIFYEALKPGKKSSYNFSFAATVFTLFLSIYYSLNYQWDLKDIIYVNIFSADKFSVLLNILIFIIGILISFVSLLYLKHNGRERSEYFIILLFAIYGMITMIQSVDLLMVFICLEIMSISVYALVAFDKDRVLSQEAALKYFLLGSFASAFYLLGMALIYGFTGTVNISLIGVHIAAGNLYRIEILLAIALIMTGLFFKMALVPFHMWSPDAYQGSPTTITAFMATAVKAASFGIFVKIMFIAFSPLIIEMNQAKFSFVETSAMSAITIAWKPIIYWVAILSMIIGNMVALSQKNIKRMLAYSSIAHAGYISLGIVAGTEDGFASILFYLIMYSIITIGAFTVVFLVDQKEENAQSIDDYKGMGFKYPFYSFILSVFLFAMVGMPPTAGFTSKFFVFASAIKEGYFFLATIGILTSVYAAFYYLRVIYYIYMKEAEKEVTPLDLSFFSTIALIACVIAVLYFGLFPEGLNNITHVAQKSLISIF